MSQPLNSTLQRIEELCEQHQWNHYRLAKNCDIPLASIQAMFSRNTCPTIPTLEKICEGFSISMSEFFDYMITPDHPALRQDEQLLVERYNKLSRHDKEILFAYLDGMLHLNEKTSIE